jgi:hypothetical protein
MTGNEYENQKRRVSDYKNILAQIENTYDIRSRIRNFLYLTFRAATTDETDKTIYLSGELKNDLIKILEKHELRLEKILEEI